MKNFSHEILYFYKQNRGDFCFSNSLLRLEKILMPETLSIIDVFVSEYFSPNFVLKVMACVDLQYLEALRVTKHVTQGIFPLRDRTQDS